ncbi:MAG: laccase domain-containing protein [Acidimicrobiales bacterium]
MRHVEPSWRLDAEGRSFFVLATDRSHGDLAIGQPLAVVDRRRRELIDAPWVWLRQEHGARVVSAATPGDRSGVGADGAVTAIAGVPIAVQVADCAPVALFDESGVIGVAHVGWRGLVAGVLDRTLDEMAQLGGTRAAAILGPCIRPESYEFGSTDLDSVAAVVGESARGVTSWGADALDLPGSIRHVLGQRGVDVVAELGGCTAVEADLRWSHRARGDRERQALVAWME